MAISLGRHRCKAGLRELPATAPKVVILAAGAGFSYAGAAEAHGCSREGISTGCRIDVHRARSARRRRDARRGPMPLGRGRPAARLDVDADAST